MYAPAVAAYWAVEEIIDGCLATQNGSEKTLAAQHQQWIDRSPNLLPSHRHPRFHKPDQDARDSFDDISTCMSTINTPCTVQ